jgi:hypothetical protein
VPAAEVGESLLKAQKAWMTIFVIQAFSFGNLNKTDGCTEDGADSCQN